MTAAATRQSWRASRVVEDEVRRYLDGGRDFIDDAGIEAELRDAPRPAPSRVRDILARSREVQTLTPGELAELIRVDDPELWAEMRAAAAEIKRKVYDNRIVTFAPLYLSNRCVNNCLYCGLRCENRVIQRHTLSAEEIRRETEVLAGRVGHKRLIVVYGEHPASDVHYMARSLRDIYDVKAPARKGWGQIRRANVNAAPMCIDDLKLLREVGIGTFQVFQETYHHGAYGRVHPRGTVKHHYDWRLYCMHRAFEAGVDDVGIGVLFGLHDWRFEVMGLLRHARELEARFGIGPHTISFPRLEPAAQTPYSETSAHRVSDEDIEKIVVLLRLAVPYTGLILTAREDARMRSRLLPLGCTQTDASSRIGIGAYADAAGGQDDRRQQFMLGDDRSLDDVVRDLARMGYITSFCTAGYRCGRTGKCIMDLLRSGQEGRFCKLNAVITFREWLDDFASAATREVGERIIAREIEEIRTRMPAVYPVFMKQYEQTAAGQRDLYF